MGACRKGERGAARAVWLIAAAAVVVLVCGGVAIVVRLQPEAGGESSDRGRAAATAGAVFGVQTQPGIEEVITFVQRARGLQFLRTPDIRLLNDDEFDALGDEIEPGEVTDAGTEADVDDAYLGVLQALGLVDEVEDFDESVSQYADVVGFYDTDTETLYVRGTVLTPYVRQVLVHELTHALDDQHFDISGEQAETDDEALAYKALVEGTATVIEGRWFDARPPGERAEIDFEEGGWPPEEDPDADFFTRLDDFGYVTGRRFVQALLDAGGQNMLDAAFARPPLTTEQILHPDRFDGRQSQRGGRAPP